MKKILALITTVFTVFTFSAVTYASSPAAVITIDGTNHNINSYNSISYQYKSTSIEVKVDTSTYQIVTNGSIKFNKINDYQVKEGVNQVTAGIISKRTLSWSKSSTWSFTDSSNDSQLPGTETGLIVSFNNVDDLITKGNISVDSGSVENFDLLTNLIIKKSNNYLNVTGAFSKIINNSAIVSLDNSYTLKVYETSTNSEVASDLIAGGNLLINSKVGYFEMTSSKNNTTYEISNDLYIVLINDRDNKVSPDITRPAVSGQENFVTNINDPKPVEYFKSFITAIDEVDGNITDKIIIETDLYTPNKNKLGKWAVTLSVMDTAGNKSEFIFYVNVTDIDAPIISGDTTVANIGYEQTFDVVAFKNSLIVTDNYDNLTNSSITINEDLYTPNKNKLGTYNITFEIKDSSNNVATFIKRVKVIDNISPVISGTLAITKSYKNVMSVTDILKNVSSNDAIDGVLTVEVETDNYTGKSDKVGTHTIIVKSTDRSGNTARKTITVTIIDDQGSNWFVTNGVTLNLTVDATLTRIQIIELLTKTGQVVSAPNSIVTYTTDNYSENIGKPGTYNLAFNIKMSNGVTNDYQYMINILAEEDDSNTDVVDTPPGLVDKITNHLVENKVKYIVGAVLVIGGIVVIKKVKEQVKKNKRKR